MHSISTLSVLIPTYQGIEFLERLLDALAGQETGLGWDVLVIDSGSTDGTWELLGERAASFPVPLRRERIDKVEFDHGDTRNLLASKSTGELCVFLTQDAVPEGRDFLERLARNFDDPAVGAAYARNVVRPDAGPVARLFADGDPGYAAERRETRIEDRAAYEALNAHEKRLLYNFNDVASAVRRELWERHPFPRTWFGEDILMARGLLEAGYTVVYDSEATVEHSHDYSPQEHYERAAIDGRFNAEWLDRTCVGSRADANALVEQVIGRASPELAKEVLNRDTSSRQSVVETFRGLYEGGRTSARRPATRMLERTGLTILYVVHGFPPDTWAGTEVYTLNLAKEMQRRGHRCTILTRAPAEASVADGGPEDFTIQEDTFEGLRVLRMTHRLAHANLRESYHQPKAEAAFRRLLLKEQPDLVHFQHLIHTSAGLVHVAKELGLPTVVHCHDYWALCARVQLIRPDGVRCEENMGSGCLLRVKETGYAHIERVKRLDRVAGPAIDALAGGLRGRSRRWEGLADLRARQDFVLDAYAAADLRVSPSRFLRSKLLESGAFDPHTFLFSDNGMRTDHVEALTKTPAADGVVRFGFVGSLVWYKGGEVMVRAMSRLAGKQAVLNVYGDFRPDEDPHHAELERIAAAVSPRNVFFKGRFDNARLSEVYAEIDVLVVPSVWFENSPITIHEAYLTHTPVLASDIGGMAEFVHDGVDGLHFAVGDADDLARKMMRFVDEPGLVDALSKDWMPIKTIAEDAAATEFRYRGLCAIVRGPVGGTGTLVEWGARETASRAGPIDEQGADLLLLRPGASVAYDIEGVAGPGAPGDAEPRTIEVELFVLGAEPDLVLGAEVRIDGVAAGRLEPAQASGQDQSLLRSLVVELPSGARRLELATDSSYLRLRTIKIRAAASVAAEGAP